MNLQLVERLAANPMQLHDLKLLYIYSVIKSCNGNRSKAAKLLGIRNCTVYRMSTLHGWTEFAGKKPRRSKEAA